MTSFVFVFEEVGADEGNVVKEGSVISVDVITIC